jgi:hypothetical protein
MLPVVVHSVRFWFEFRRVGKVGYTKADERRRGSLWTFETADSAHNLPYFY